VNNYLQNNKIVRLNIYGLNGIYLEIFFIDGNLKFFTAKDIL